MGLHLTAEQRYKIETLHQEKFSQREIARRIGKHHTTVSRELRRNRVPGDSHYHASSAQKLCGLRHREKNKRVVFTEEIRKRIETLLLEDYSPEQIVGVSKNENIACVSHERIYQHVWHDKKRGGNFYKHLRTKGKRYRKRGSLKDRRGRIPGRVGIENRPEIVDKKRRFGDLEMDLVIGKGHKKAILTINDRTTGVVKIGLLQSKSSEEVKNKAVELLQEWLLKIHTITSDNGKEFTLHEQIAQKLSVEYYFADPYKSWQRGANENVNGLLRQYFGKKHDFDSITEAELKQAEDRLNNRPRKRFGFLSPKQIYLILINNQVVRL